MRVLYGIKNCDKVKQARKFLDSHEFEYRFHDIRVDGLNENLLMAWVEKISWETLVNTRSKTWHNLTPSEKQGLNQAQAIHLICQYPTLMKRPVLNVDDKLIVGFDEEQYKEIIDEHSA